jgi:hypothetical protein
MLSSYVILDEADRMIDLGFEIDLNLILDSMPATSLSVEDSTSATADVSQLRVTSLYSATMPIQVERIARKYLRKPATITIGDAGEAAQTVQQIVEFIASDEKKKARLIDILRNGGFAAPIVSNPFICYTELTKCRSSSSTRSALPMSSSKWCNKVVGQRPPCIPTRLRHNVKLLFSSLEMEKYRLWLLLMSPVEVWTSLMSVSLPIQLRLSSICTQLTLSACTQLADG